jgi:hypothetical protein
VEEEVEEEVLQVSYLLEVEALQILEGEVGSLRSLVEEEECFHILGEEEGCSLLEEEGCSLLEEEGAPHALEAWEY